MKTSVFVMSALLLGLHVFAQENFQGKITYTLESETDHSKNIFAEVFLKETKMLLVGKNEKKKRPFRYLYDFKKGLCYSLNFEDSIALITKLTSSPFSEIKRNDTGITMIQNYKTRKVSYANNSSMLNSFKEIEAWFSKDLLYKIPDSVRFITPPFILFNDNSISLRTRMSFTNMPAGSPVPGTIMINASEIIKQVLNDSVFEIPKILRRITLEDYSAEILKKFNQVDSTLSDKKRNFEMKIVGKPVMTEAGSNSAVPPPPPNPAKNKKN